MTGRRVSGQMVLAILLAASMIGALPSRGRGQSAEGCCELGAPDGCFSPINKEGCDILGNIGFKVEGFVPGGVCVQATENCRYEPSWADADLMIPSRVYLGETMAFNIRIRNIWSGSITPGDVRISFNLPDKPDPDLGPFNIPFAPVEVPPGGTVDVPLGDVQIPPDLKVGFYYVDLGIYGPGGMGKLGGSRRSVIVAPLQGMAPDGANDCVQPGGAPVPSEDCTERVDLLAAWLTTPGNTIQARLQFRSGPLSRTLVDGERSRSWNLVWGGGACNIGLFSGVGRTLTVEEKEFDVPGSPMTIQWRTCQDGSLVPDPTTSAGFTITGATENLAEIWADVPPGLNPQGATVGVAAFGLRQGGPQVGDFMTVDVPVGSGY